MDELNNAIVESLQDYMYELAVYGYKSRGEVNKLLALQYLGELLQGELSIYITEEDYKCIGRALYCLYGSSCLIPYPQYIVDTSRLNFKLKPSLPRVSEGEDLRTSEDEDVRVTI